MQSLRRDDTIAADRFRLAPRVKRTRGIFVNLESPKSRSALPPLKAVGQPDMLLANMRGGRTR